ncbi:thioredoxin family protein [Chryseobacterium sp. LAM-KRS1]|uniref:thioredoxin family protein n=1 Tax=Chryseobacterium sp. LAM-KRS1 TaxID=2715754 RepID=UPI0015554466|nr:thioredoxin family protein [Chryseobacterium sp. LAM-KRS1]
MITHKKYQLLYSLLAFLFTVNFYTAQQKTAKANISPEEINFRNISWKEVSAEAKKSGKTIFVDAYTSWCGPCKLLKSKTFKDKIAAGYFNRNFINYTIDMEKGEGIELAKDWKVNSYPSLLFFDPNGKLLLRQIGYVDGKGLIELGKEALEKK